MTRVDHVAKNGVYNFLKYFLQLFLQFALRTVLIYKLGKEYLGLNGLFSNILGILNLAELGIGGAISFCLYKPIAENDTKKINSLLNLYKKFYILIASFVFLAGILITPFLPYLINGNYPSEINIYVVYLVLLLNSVMSYFSAHKRTLIYSNQRNDIESKIKIGCISSLYLLQILLLIIFKNYYYYIVLLPLFTMIENIIVVIVANKMFPMIKEKPEKIDEKTKEELKKKLFAMSIHQIGGVLVLSTDNIIISSMIGLDAVGIYSNYLLIINSLISLIGIICNSIQASVGNMVVLTNKDYVMKKYDILNFGYVWLVGWSTICMICLFQPFIILWTNNIEYLLPISVVFTICLSFYLKESLGISNMFKNVAGLMWHDRFSPLIQGSINIVFSIVLCDMFGIIGVFLGTIISTIAGPLLLTPIVLYKCYFNKSVFCYWKKFLKETMLLIVIGVLTYYFTFLVNKNLNLLNFMISCIICLVLPNVIYLILNLRNKNCLEFLSLVKSIFKKIFKMKRKEV